MPFAKPKPREPSTEPELFDYACGSLGRRMRTEWELRRLLLPRVEPGETGQHIVDSVLARLRDLGYLSDTHFAETFTRIRKESRGFGARRVRQDLAAEGVDKELAGSAVETAFAAEDEVALARAYCERKRIQPPDPSAPRELRAKDAARITGRLLRAGYSGPAISKLLRTWRIEVPEDSEDILPDPDAHDT